MDNNSDVRARLDAALRAAEGNDADLLRDAIREIDSLRSEIRFTWEAWVQFVGKVESAAASNPRADIVACVGNVSIEGPAH